MLAALLQRLAMLTLLALPLLVHPWAAAQTLHFGMLAFRPKASIEQQWRPMAAYLEGALGRPVELTVYDHIELETAIRRNAVDVVLTNPGHFILLQHRDSLSAALATLVLQDGDQELSSFGGTIIARADAAALKTLADLAGKRIAVVNPQSMGGYQIQTYEMLQAGMLPPKPQQLLSTELPHDRVVDAVLSGRAEAGFLRSGILEAMAKEGKLDMARIRVVNAQHLSAFPFAVSTRLYPEWPVAVLPHVGEHVARQLTVALLSLPPEHPAARAAGIHGFTNTANYGAVEEMLRTLRAPPYSGVPAFTYYDLWRRFGAWIIATGGLLLLVISVSVLLAMQAKYLRQSKGRLLTMRNDLQSTLEAIPDLLIEMGLDGTQYRFHSPRTDLLVLPAPALVGQHLAQSLPAQAVATYMAALQEAHSNGYSSGRQIELDIAGKPKWFELSVARKVAPPSEGERFIVLSRDITERKRDEAQLQLAASVFTHTQEAIIITDADAAIVEVNEAFSRMTGYSREEALGCNPRILKSARHSPEHYAALWRALTDHGFWLGEMWNRRKDGQEYACLQSISVVRNAQGQPQNYVALLNDITAIKDHERQLEHITHFDRLTGLPNRVLLVDRLQQAIAHSQRHKHPLALAFLDLDGFKLVNDSFGHATGDELLKAVANKVKSALREGDTLARIGGDEFVVLLVDLDSVQEYETVLGRLLEAVAQPVVLEGHAVQVSASMGVTVFPQDGADADQLMRHADQAMYLAKQAGRNRYHLFDIAHDASVKSQREGVQRIERALDGNEFVLYYQPKVNMKTGKVIGAEALIRWLHPERGLLPPGDFLPLIEDHAVSVRLGEWVLKSALQQMSQWQSSGLNMPVSVNIGARQLQSPDFTSRLRDILASQPQVSPAALELEILETRALEDIAEVSAIMRACQALGVTFALDDFGTGYSSLTYLRRLPAELLKIDQSFVRDMLEDHADLAIVQGVIGLAAAFQRSVIAEGVETVVHGSKLLRMGCELAQGYGISRPMPAGQLPQWLVAWSPDASWVV